MLWTGVPLGVLCLFSLGHSQDNELDDLAHFDLKEDCVSIVDNCFYEDHQYAPTLPAVAAAGNSTGCSKQQSLASCQQACQSEPICQFFTFWNATQQCCLAGSDAYYQAGPGAVTGPKECQEVASGCRELPGLGFPGPTAAASQLAWPSNRVPDKLECWPRNRTVGRYLPCDEVTVLEDSASGFPGRCLGLRQITNIPQFETCELLCRQAPFCSIFQVMKDNPYGPKSCWHGYASTGTDCFLNRETVIPVRAQRFMQGSVRVLRNTSDVQIMGLKNVFPPIWFVNASSAVRACRNQCYSSILCQYWQYIRHTGCWLEEPALMPPLPFPTTEEWHLHSNISNYVLAGEYIQHTCKAVRGSVAHTLLTTTTTAPFLGTVYHGSLGIGGLSYANLTRTQRLALRKLYVQDIADEVGVELQDVKDIAGNVGSVLLYPCDEEGLPGFDVKFNIDIPVNVTHRQIHDTLHEPAFLQKLVETTTKCLRQLRLKESAKSLADSDAEPPMQSIHVRSVDLDGDLTKPLPWYCLIVLCVMLLACGLSGWWGYRRAQDQKDEEDFFDDGLHSDGSSSPAASPPGSPLASPLATSGFGGMPYGQGNGAAQGQQGHAGGLRATAREVVAKVENSAQRAEHRVAGMLPTHFPGQGAVPGAIYSQLGAQGAAPVGPSKDQLMQFAHQGGR